MKLSEAIRLGAMLKPQGRRGFFDGGNTCALGAAADAIGRLNDLLDGRFLESKEWPLLSEMAAHPVTLWTRSVWDVVTSMNDIFGWTREQIADWVETIEREREAQPNTDAQVAREALR